MGSDDPRDVTTRVRHRLSERLALAVAACFLLAAAGGFVAYAEASGPDSTVEQETVGTWTTDSEFNHRATVTRGTAAFDAGTVLRNRSAYVQRVAPELTATHVYRHDGNVEPASVTTNVTLVKRSVGTTTEGDVEYWRVTEPVTTSEATVQPGSAHRTEFMIDVAEQRNRSRQIEAELGGTPGQVQIFAVVTTRAETSLAGEATTTTRTDRLALEPTGSTYSVSENATGEVRAGEVTESVSVPVESDPARIYGGALIALLAGGAGLGLVVADRRDRLAVPPATARAIEAAQTRDAFDEWISNGRVPEPGDSDRRVDVDSLEDLVDVAIDSDRRVVHDRDADRYVVIDDRTWYWYDPAREHSNDASRRPGEPEAGVASSAESVTDGDGPDLPSDGSKVE
jgi:hypothetical protein